MRGKPGGDNDDVRIGRGLVIVGAGDRDVVALDRPGLQQVEPLALRNAFDHVHQNDIGQFLIRDAQRAIGADVSGAYNRNFFSQRNALLEISNCDYSGNTIVYFFASALISLGKSNRPLGISTL